MFLANGEQRLDMAGHYSYSKAYRVEATLKSFDLGGLRELSGIDLADLDGTIDGTLSLTGVPGHPRIDAEGQLRTIDAEGLLAVCVQHELDHLLGKVFVEYLSPLKRNRIKSKMLKAQREELRETQS